MFSCLRSLEILLTIYWIHYGCCCLSENRIGVCIEFYLHALLLKAGKLPPVRDGGEHLPQQDGQHAHGYNTANNSLEDEKGVRR